MKSRIQHKQANSTLIRATIIETNENIDGSSVDIFP